MAGTGLLHGPAERLQRLPAALGCDVSQAQFGGHPGGHFGTAPQPPIRWRREQALAEFVQQIRLEDGRACAIAAAQIAERVRPLSVVAGEQALDPARGKADGGRDLADLVAFGEQPDGVEVASGRGVLARAIVLLQCRHAQVICDTRHAGSPWLMALSLSAVPNAGNPIRPHQPESV